MGHRVRCSNQNIAIGKTEERLKDAYMNNRSNKGIIKIMIGVFKMKF